jgi:hypothetical protein
MDCHTVCGNAPAWVAGHGILSYRKGSLTLWTAAAALLAFAVLVRPATLAVSSTVMLLLIWAAWKHHISVARGVSSGTLLVVVHAMFLLPVMNHNASQGQGYSVSTNNEWNLLVGNNPYTPNYKTGHFGQRTFDKIDVDARAYLSAFLPHQQPANATFSERQQMRSEAIEYIVDHPLQFLYRVSNRFRGFWGMDYTASRELQNAYGLGITQTGVLLLLEGGGFIFVLLLSLLYYVRTGLDTRNSFYSSIPFSIFCCQIPHRSPSCTFSTGCPSDCVDNFKRGTPDDVST